MAARPPQIPPLSDSFLKDDEDRDMWLFCLLPNSGDQYHIAACHAEPQRSISYRIGMRDPSLRLRPELRMTHAKNIAAPT